LGSGTTGKMAKILNRKFIGIEKDETYFEIAKERLK
jgi:site-specific DNA-methyltransferase (adenine-specific)